MMQLFSRFKRDRRGVAAVEFAMILPLMLLVLFGTVELTEALATNRRAENVATSIADIVARDVVITDEEITDLWTAANALMFPNFAAPMQMRVTSVEIDEDSEATVLWSEAHGMSARAGGSSISVPAGMATPSTSIIMTETTYTYTPPIGVFLDVAFNLEHTEYRRPRVADPVGRED
jgi:Flp pilus assembly protein TadG